MANAALNKQPFTPIIIGSYIFVFVLAILDMFGPPLSNISGGLAMVAVVYVLINEFPWEALISILQGKSASPTAQTSSTTAITVPSTATQTTL